MTYLWDADAVIDHLTGQPGARALHRDSAREGLAVSIVTYLELYEGALRSRNPKEALRALKAFLRRVTVLPVSRRVAEQTARLRADLRARHRPVQHRAYDLLVAATAQVYGLTLVTSNTRDYSDISNLPRLNTRTF